MTNVDKAKARLIKLKYWLDTDLEIIERMTWNEQADHFHMVREVNAALAELVASDD
jgi:hypothetical protein